MEFFEYYYFKSMSICIFLRIVVEVKDVGVPCVLVLWLGVSKGMLSVKYFCSSKFYFYDCQFSLRSLGCHKDKVNLVTLSFEDITGFKTVICLFY